jgi:hypothetical protein
MVRKLTLIVFLVAFTAAAGQPLSAAQPVHDPDSPVGIDVIVHPDRIVTGSEGCVVIFLRNVTEKQQEFLLWGSILRHEETFLEFEPREISLEPRDVMVVPLYFYVREEWPAGEYHAAMTAGKPEEPWIEARAPFAVVHPSPCRIDLAVFPKDIMPGEEGCILSFLSNVTDRPLDFLHWGEIRFRDEIFIRFEPAEIHLEPGEKKVVPTFFFVEKDWPSGEYTAEMSAGFPDEPWTEAGHPFMVLKPSPVHMELGIHPREVRPGERLHVEITLFNRTEEDVRGSIWGALFHEDELIRRVEARTFFLKPEMVKTIENVYSIPGDARPGAYHLELFVGPDPEEIWEETRGGFFILPPGEDQSAD